MKRAIFNVFIGLSVLTGGLMALNSAMASPRSTSNLRTYQNNLDILSDKGNNLHELIEEVQRPFVKTTTGAVAGGYVKLPGISTSDTITFVTVHTSANIVNATTVTFQQTNNDGTAGATIRLRSKLWGTAGNAIQPTFTQGSTTTLGALTVNTTGYAFEVFLSSGDEAAHYSSGTAVVEAINASPSASLLVFAEVVTFGTATVRPIGQFWLMNGSGTPQGSHYIPGSFFTITSSQTVQASTGAPVRASDGFTFFGFDRPDAE